MIENFKLHVFRTVADTLNFSKAAEELHLSQPAVTSQVRSLEEGLGIALFDRVGRNATLTPAGNTLLPFVRQIETLTSDAIAALAPFGVQEGVKLNIGASHTVGVYLLPRLLPALVREWPKLQIHIVSVSTGEILNAHLWWWRKPDPWAVSILCRWRMDRSRGNSALHCLAVQSEKVR